MRPRGGAGGHPAICGIDSAASQIDAELHEFVPGGDGRLATAGRPGKGEKKEGRSVCVWGGGLAEGN